jgi:hypothetical protein
LASCRGNAFYLKLYKKSGSRWVPISTVGDVVKYAQRAVIVIHKEAPDKGFWDSALEGGGAVINIVTLGLAKPVAQAVTSIVETAADAVKNLACGVAGSSLGVVAGASAGAAIGGPSGAQIGAAGVQIAGATCGSGGAYVPPPPPPPPSFPILPIAMVAAGGLVLFLVLK